MLFYKFKKAGSCVFFVWLGLASTLIGNLISGKFALNNCPISDCKINFKNVHVFGRVMLYLTNHNSAK